MKILFASDFHLGASRKAGYTPESSARREDYAYDLLEQILKTPHDYAICGGDFFDKFTNSETCIARASEVAKSFDFILPGNHDLSSRESVIGSLELLYFLRQREYWFIRSNDLFGYQNMHVFVVPHQLTQERFIEELGKAELAAQAGGHGTWKILLLHCNYNSPFELNDSSLNLPREKAHELLSTFHYILLGHEHRALDDFDGRLRIIGSHLPTTLDDLTDKRHLVFDTDTGHLESITHWRAADHAYAGPAAGAPAGRQFYVLTDLQDHKLPVQLFKEGAFAVKVEVSGRAAATETATVQALRPLPEQVETELAQHPELLALWKEFTA